METQIETLTRQLSEDLKAFATDQKNLKDGYTYEKEFDGLIKRYGSELLKASLGATSKDRNKKNGTDHLW